MRKPLCWGAINKIAEIFNEIAGINSSIFSEKSLHQRHLPVNVLELSAPLQEGLT